MSGAGADDPVEGAKGGAGKLIIAPGGAAVFSAVVDCLRARLGVTGTGTSTFRYHRSYRSRQSSRNYRGDQGRSPTHEDEMNLIIRPGSDVASVAECNATAQKHSSMFHKRSVMR